MGIADDYIRQLRISLKANFQRILREGSAFRRVLTKIDKLDVAGEDARRAFQLESLKKVAIHAEKQVPHWQRVFRSAGLDPCEIKSVDDLKKLPLLTKKEVQAEPGAFLSKNAAKWKLSKGLTSGTTGTPGEFFRDMQSVVFENALIWHLRGKAGMEPGCRIALLRGDIVVSSGRRTPPFWLRNFGSNSLAISTYHLTPRYREEILDAIEQFKPAGAFAYPSAAFVLAKWCDDLGRELPFPNLHTSSETVLAEQREIIANRLPGKWIDHYGQAERVNLLASFDAGEYREYTEYGVTELLPLNNGRYEIVGTSLHNYAMPLFRYRTGDVVEGRESVGQDRPIIKGLTGRKEDFVTLPDGSIVGRLDLVFKGLKNIQEGQIYQPSIDHVTIRVVPGPEYGNEDERKVLANARDRLGTEVSINVEHMKSIARTKNGKLKFVISQIPVVDDR